MLKSRKEIFILPKRQYDENINKGVTLEKFLAQKKVLNSLHATKIMKWLPCCLLSQEISEYVKSFDNAKSMSFLVGDEKLLKKYNEIWKRSLKKLQQEKKLM